MTAGDFNATVAGEPGPADVTVLESDMQIHEAVDEGAKSVDNIDHGEQEKILSLPPPPSYDVHIDNLSIGVPPHRLYIPTPIPIPIPQKITDAFRRAPKTSDVTHHRQSADNLIIRNVTARVDRGEMMAIIGGSGSGKTTLLHAIANRTGGLPITEGRVSFVPSASGGDDPAQGPLKAKGMSEVVGFVRQNDYLLPHLTGK